MAKDQGDAGTGSGQVDAQDVQRGTELIQLASESLGGLGIGFAVGGPIGGAAGAATLLVTRVLALVGHQIRNQFGPREEIRIGGALGVAVERISERLDAGETPRDDGLFEPGADPQGLLEGTLRAAASSYEERKIPFIGRFYASLVFDRSVSPATAVATQHRGDTRHQLRVMNRLNHVVFVRTPV
jgi:hypothetical protein